MTVGPPDDARRTTYPSPTDAMRAPGTTSLVLSGARAVEPAPAVHDPPPARLRVLLYVAGSAMLVFGLRGVVLDVHGWEHPRYWTVLFLAGALGHDLVFAPLVVVLAALLARVVPERARRAVVTGLGTSGVLGLIALPGLRSTGHLADNRSVLPLDYGRGLLVSLAVVWGLLAGWGILRVMTARVRRR